MNEEIIIDIDEQGNVKLEVNGVIGPGCTELTKEIEKALGDTTKQTTKPEFRQSKQANKRRHKHDH